jgi:hypothetical protein
LRDGLLVDLWKKFKFTLQGLVGAVALLLFLVSAGINISTWVYPAIARFANLLMLTHLAVLISAAAYSLLSRKTDRASQRKSNENSPAWVQAVSTALFAYLFLSIGFVFLSSVIEGAHKDITDGASDSVGETIQLEKSSKWYPRGDLFALRLGSIFWMLFSFQTATAWFFRDFTTRFGRYDGVVKKL